MKKYIPINCNYYDELEALATKREFVEIQYRGENGAAQTVSSRIINFFIKEKVEFLQLQSGEEIRLDYLVSVNGLRPPNDNICKV